MRQGAPLLDISLEVEVIHWRGPAPFFFAPLPAGAAAQIRQILRAVTYGWGMVPVEATLNGADFTTSLFPKDQTYLLPLKAAVRRSTGVTAGDRITVTLRIYPPR